MTIVTAKLNDYRQSPRKVRVVAQGLKGKRVEDALNILEFLAKRGANPLGTLIKSAIANAKNLSLNTDNLVIKELRVDGGSILYRRRSASRGRAPSIRKRTSHVLLVLEEKAPRVKKVRKNKE
jgi:large subunit ribosomal protein L22